MKRKFYLHIQLIITLLLTATSGVCGFAQTQTVVTSYRANGTFTVPHNVDHIVVECWGAGGGGGSRSSNGGNGGGGGGGGGAYASSTINSPAQGTTYTITVGMGGTAGNNGGNTSFGSEIVAAGGSGVANNTTTGGAGGTTGASKGKTIIAGGNGGTATSSYSGGGGGAAGSSGAGGNGAAPTAGIGGAGTIFIVSTERNGAVGVSAGNGNSLTNPTSTNNSTNGTYGGGGSGAFCSGGSVTGGEGSVGYVRITIYYTNLPICTSGNWTEVTGSLQTFGTGNVTSKYLKTAPTNLIWSGNCPNDGSYTIQSSSPNCFSGSWVAVSEDHTAGDTNGNFLIVNGNTTPSTIYTQNVSSDACSNTTYRISFWALNPHKNLSSQLPNVELDLYKADGTTLISSYLTGDIPLAVDGKDWKQYYATFQLPSGTSSYVLGMILTTPGGPIYGSDIFIDDIEVEKCDPTIISTISSFTSCQNSPFTLSANAAPYDTPVYQWQRSIDQTTYNDIAGATTLSYNYTESTPGTYYYRLLAAASATDLNTIKSGNKACGVSSDIKQLTVYAIPTISGQPSTSSQTLCQNSAATALSVTATDGSGYQWYSNITPSNSGGTLISGATRSSYTPSTSVAGTLYYYVIVTNSNGCTFTSNVSGAITVNPLPTVNVGSALTAICQGGTTATLGGTYGGGATSAIWSDGGAGGSFTDNGGSTPNTVTYTASATAPASVTLTLTTKGGSCGTITASKQLIVNALPTTYSVTGGGSYCVGGSGVPVGLSGSESGVNYQLQLNGSNSGALVAGTGSTISFGNQISAGTYTVTATNASTGCSVIMNRNATITINSLPATPTVSNSIVSNTCPSATVNIATLVTSSKPSDCSMLYKTTNDPTGVDVTDPTKVGAGTYYIFYKNTSGCSSFPATSVTVTIHSCNDLSVTKVVSDMNPLVGSEVTFTITAVNASSNPATGLTVSDVLSPGYTYKSSATVTGYYDSSTGIWVIGTLSSGASATLTIKATVNQ